MYMKKIYRTPSAIYVDLACESNMMGGSIPIKPGEGDFGTKRQDLNNSSIWGYSYESDSDL